MREQYEIVKKLASELHEQSNILDQKINDKWKFHYSDVDYEMAIDTLDYGTSDLSFDEFVKWMNTEGKKRHKSNKGIDY